MERDSESVESDTKDGPTEISGPVNRGGFPVDETTWQKMWDHAAKVHPDGNSAVEQIRGNTALIRMAIPQPPNLSSLTTMSLKVQAIQTYLEEFQYNHTGMQFFEIKKGRSLSRMMEKAKEMMKAALPIKCLEAVIIGLYLTSGLSSVERFILGFKTQCEGHCHKHVVLGVYHAGLFGCVGLSRRADLMYKPLAYQSLHELVCDFQNSYEQYFHTILRVKLSLPVTHDPYSGDKIHWGYLRIDVQKVPGSELRRLLDRYTREMKTKSFHAHLPLRCESSPPAMSNGLTGNDQQLELLTSDMSSIKPSQTKSNYKVQV